MSGRPPATFVLVHGLFHGAWCWRRVVDPLRAAGHRVYPLTLTGLGERAHLLSDRVSLDTFVADVIGVLESEELTDVTLVGHSFGAVPVLGVAYHQRYRADQVSGRATPRPRRRSFVRRLR